MESSRNFRRPFTLERQAAAAATEGFDSDLFRSNRSSFASEPELDEFDRRLLQSNYDLDELADPAYSSSPPRFTRFTAQTSQRSAPRSYHMPSPRNYSSAYKPQVDYTVQDAAPRQYMSQPGTALPLSSTQATQLQQPLHPRSSYFMDNEELQEHTTQSSSPTFSSSLPKLSKPRPKKRSTPDDSSPSFRSKFPRAVGGSKSSSSPSQLDLAYVPKLSQGIELVTPLKLPDRLRQLFPYPAFNAVQSKCFETLYHTDENIVVSAPTGSGKTCLLELAICRLATRYGSEHFKIVYQAPTKSLCSERTEDWQKKFLPLNLTCAELTGDTTQVEMSKVVNASIIVTTPEKWDSVTRKWRDHVKLLEQIKLFLIDEVHILKDLRGATLEAVVSRMKTLQTNVRFIALSATVPNAEDVATWLGRIYSNTSLPARLETFGEEFRPVKLQKFVHSFDAQRVNDYQFDKILDAKIPSMIAKYSHRKPVMIFCFTRKSCENTAVALSEWWSRSKSTGKAWTAPSNIVSVSHKELQQTVTNGIAFHHAGLDAQDRHAIQTGFLDGNISVICCTSTLAVGVNLPCHLVIIKNTICYQNNQLIEYSDLEIMQMLGRAGRPQFDTEAVALIMTSNDKAAKYQTMLSGRELLESTLHLNLIEHLNSEICLGTVYNIASAQTWLSGTFLYVRLHANPKHYDLGNSNKQREPKQQLIEVCNRDFNLLVEAQLVTREAGRFCSTAYGEAMSRFMISFETMKILLNIPSQAKISDIIRAVSQAHEFRDIRIKPSERSWLRELNKSPFIKYPIKENISTTSHKVSIMMQAQLGGADVVNDQSFNRRQYAIEKGILFDRIQRLIRCVIDCKSYDCDAESTRNALDLARSLSAEYWENSPLQLRQIAGVGPAAAQRFIQHNIKTIEQLCSTDQFTIERYMSRNPPYGKNLLDKLIDFPLLTLTSDIANKIIKPGFHVRVKVKSTLGMRNKKIPIWQGRIPLVTFIAETSSGQLVHFWRGTVKQIQHGFDLHFVAELESSDDNIICHLACEEIVGTVRQVILHPGISASSFSTQKVIDTSAVNRAVSSNSSTDHYEVNMDDEELLALVEMAEVAPEMLQLNHSEFVDLEDEESEAESSTEPQKKVLEESENLDEPVQLPSGKWKCHHRCAGELTRTGKPCKHKCCHEGLDKRPGRRKVMPKYMMKSGKNVESTKSSEAKAPWGKKTPKIQDLKPVVEELDMSNEQPWAQLASRKASDNGVKRIVQRVSSKATSVGCDSTHSPYATQREEFPLLFALPESEDESFSDMELDLFKERLEVVTPRKSRTKTNTHAAWPVSKTDGNSAVHTDEFFKFSAFPVDETNSLHPLSSDETQLTQPPPRKGNQGTDTSPDIENHLNGGRANSPDVNAGRSIPDWVIQMGIDPSIYFEFEPVVDFN